jgi:hypothetical protein
MCHLHGPARRRQALTSETFPPLTKAGRKWFPIEVLETFNLTTAGQVFSELRQSNADRQRKDHNADNAIFFGRIVGSTESEEWLDTALVGSAFDPMQLCCAK